MILQRKPGSTLSKYIARSLMITSIIFTITSFKTYSTPLLITSDTLEVPERINLDSVRKLVPIGFYILTEQGAKKSLKSKIDAETYYQKWQIADNALGQMSIKVATITMQRNQVMDINLRNAGVISGLETKLKWAIFWKYAAISAAAALGTQLIIR